MGQVYRLLVMVIRIERECVILGAGHQVVVAMGCSVRMVLTGLKVLIAPLAFLDRRGDGAKDRRHLLSLVLQLNQVLLLLRWRVIIAHLRGVIIDAQLVVEALLKFIFVLLKNVLLDFAVF